MAIQDHWHRRSWLSWLLLPAAAVFGALSAARRCCYRYGLLRAYRAPVPVIVVGNITVGGTGKTPLVTYLANALTDEGYRVGVVSRGYGGSAGHAQAVAADSLPEVVGDEALVIARNSAARVWVGRRRADAVAGLLREHPCDVVLSDDGLQHYGLQRDVEIAVIDAARGLGNGWLLPAGPLREPPSRLHEVHMVVANGDDGDAAFVFRLRISRAVNLTSGEQCRLADFTDTEVHAVAGIGHPARFFGQLRALGIVCEEHAFPDHYGFRPADVDFGDQRPVLLTEKDAVKCAGFKNPRLWCVPAVLEDRDARIATAVSRLLRDR